MSARKFDPQPGEALELFDRRFVVQPHPVNPTYVFSSDGQRGTVYQLREAKTRETFALKVFKKRYQEPALAEGLARLDRLRDLPGMRAARRKILLPGDPPTLLIPELNYAVLMPWIQGKTWYDVLVSAWRDGIYLSQDSAVRLCEQFLSVMAGLEAAGVAHSDISPGNVTIEVENSGVQLLDLEDAYIPGSPPPRYLNMGSAGYRHSSAGRISFWCPEGDRYAGAVLAAEMLVLAKHDLARDSTDQGFFSEDRTSETGRQRFARAMPWLYTLAPEFAEGFLRAWEAQELTDCPRLSELHQVILPLADAVAPLPRKVVLLQAASPPVPSPPKKPSPVQWQSWNEAQSSSSKNPTSPSARSSGGTQGPQKTNSSAQVGCFLLVFFVALLMLAVPGLNAFAGCLLPVLVVIAIIWMIAQARK